VRSWRRPRRPRLSAGERNLLIRLDAGDSLCGLDYEEFSYLKHLESLGLVVPVIRHRCRELSVELTEKGRVIVLGVKARRWVEEHGTRGESG
jgi:hypothetical protein